jgi:hypothetical protein
MAALVFLLTIALLFGLPLLCSQLGGKRLRFLGKAIIATPPIVFFGIAALDLFLARAEEHLADFGPWEVLATTSAIALAWLLLTGTGYWVGLLLKRDGMGSSSDASP